jgi:hypothetical protein
MGHKWGEEEREGLGTKLCQTLLCSQRGLQWPRPMVAHRGFLLLLQGQPPQHCGFGGRP